MPSSRTVPRPTAAPRKLRSHPAPASLPTTGFVRQPQLLAVIPISKATLWRRVKLQTFPRPVKLSERVTAWRAEDLHRWIEHHADE